MPRPSLTVIVVSWNSRRTIRRCLESLAGQTWRDFHTILVDSGTDGAAELARRQFPSVHVIGLSERKYPGDARNIGCRAADSDVIAFLDSDCVADPDWAERIVEAHEQCPDLIIGGSVGLFTPAGPISTATYFTEFSIWMPRQGTRSYVPVIPTCCWSMKRMAWEQFGPFLEGTYCSDTDLNWRAAAAGHRPLFDPSIRVSHIGPVNFIRFVRKFHMHGRAFAEVRLGHIDRTETAIRACTGPVVPLMMVARLLQREALIRYRPWRFLAALPLTVAGICAWSAGELSGYWSGWLSSKARAVYRPSNL
jgi:GT2 family glycosyltransferase